MDNKPMVRIAQVVFVHYTEGKGTEKDPWRTVTAIYDMDGAFITKVDSEND